MSPFEEFWVRPGSPKDSLLAFDSVNQQPILNEIDRPQIYAAKRMFDGTRHVWTGWVWDIQKEIPCPSTRNRLSCQIIAITINSLLMIISVVKLRVYGIFPLLVRKYWQQCVSIQKYHSRLFATVSGTRFFVWKLAPPNLNRHHRYWLFRISVLCQLTAPMRSGFRTIDPDRLIGAHLAYPSASVVKYPLIIDLWKINPMEKASWHKTSTQKISFFPLNSRRM